MELNDELKNIVDILNSQKTIALLAPSFVVDFKYPDIILELRKLGFNKVVELTYAAKIISMHYHELVKDNLDNDKQIICANCPGIVNFIKFKHPQHLDKLANIASPMVLMGRIAKDLYKDNFKTVFIGPCILKKQEAKEYEDSVNYAITFKELKQIIDYYKENKLFKDISNIPKEDAIDFDKFYNDYTKIYPLAGGVAQTMHANKLLTKEQVLIVDGPANLDSAIKNMENNKNIKFIDALFCDGGCIGGPGIINTDSIETRKQKVIDYRNESRKHKIGSKLGEFKYERNINIKRIK